MLLESSKPRLHLGESGRRRTIALRVLPTVELALSLTDESLPGGNGLASRGELVARAEKELLGVAELREAGLDLGEPSLVRSGRRRRGSGLRSAFALGLDLTRSSNEGRFAFREGSLTVGEILLPPRCLKGVFPGIGLRVPSDRPR